MRILLCTQYYALADASAQKSYICSLVVENNTILRRRHRSEEAEKTHSIARSYFLQVKDMNIRVCLKFLCDTFKFSTKTVFNALKFKMNGMYVGKDGRKAKPAPNGTPESIILGIKEHIDSFPKIESHYCQRDTKKRYLHSSLNISIMFRLYKKELFPKNSVQGASYDKYRQVFNNCNPPLAFYCPKRRKLEALQSKEADKKKAKTDKGFRAITFDMQRILSIPHAGDAQIFCKRKLNVYNFTIFEGHNSDGHCFLWDETNGGKGSCEVSTCLLKYLSSLPDAVKHVSSFSDTCSGWNRNKCAATAMLYAVNNFAVEKIDLKFMEPEHSYLEADFIHSTIERTKKHKKIYSVNSKSKM
ncbi:uncharacterized protein LOC136085726 [Hydra vulgaris]|uniref:Uncharacterized protein LOC136085726 n=1 Tax=Hydra vulgaris TaxID=6087 RepID=A0ABM4CMW2_HYDVU